MKFSEKIVRLRKIKGITQDEFANAVGVSRQAVYKWECGQSYPEASKLIEIKALFGISIDDLLDDSYEIALPEKKKRKRIAKVKVENTEKAAPKEIPSEITDVKEEVATVVEVEAESSIEVNEAAPEIAVTEPEPMVTETVTDEAENIINEITPEKTVEEPVYAAAPTTPVVTPEITPAVEEKKPAVEEKQEVKKRGFFSRIFGRK